MTITPRKDSEEISQDVFIRVFHNIKKFNQRSSFRTWLYRIVHNCCYTRIKQQKIQTIFFVRFKA
ncbi:MAG: RNA polymerase sigma factor [Nitrospinaceae bacterium]|nr:RNA polymerase sigma factor [Nitrospinaceae bacterium]